MLGSLSLQETFFFHDLIFYNTDIHSFEVYIRRDDLQDFTERSIANVYIVLKIENNLNNRMDTS